jgi:hypothetical protein
MAKTPATSQSGGVNIHGSTVTVGGDISGRDKIINQGHSRELEEMLRRLTELISAAPPENRAGALARLADLKKEAAKGEKRDDGVLAKLVEGIVELVPSAASAVVSAFSTPILGAIASPMTKYVLDKISNK